MGMDDLEGATIGGGSEEGKGGVEGDGVKKITAGAENFVRGRALVVEVVPGEAAIYGADEGMLT